MAIVPEEHQNSLLYLYGNKLFYYFNYIIKIILNFCDKIERSVLSQLLPLVFRCSSASFLNETIINVITLPPYFVTAFMYKLLL